MANPRDARCINLSIDCAARNGGLLRNNRIGVLQCCRRRCLDARNRIVLMTDDDVSPTCQMRPEIVIPRVKMTIAVRNHNEWTWSHRSDVCWIPQSCKSESRSCADSDVTIQSGYCERSSCSWIARDPKTSTIVTTIDQITKRKPTISIHVDDKVISTTD